MRPAGLNQWLARKTPIGLAESLLPRVGGWVCELQRRTGARACYSQWLSHPPPTAGGGEPPYLTACPRVQRLRHYVAILSVPPNPGLTFVNPPGRCTRGLTGQNFRRPCMKLKCFFCQFPNPWTLRVSGMGGYTSKCEKKSKSLHPTGHI